MTKPSKKTSSILLVVTAVFVTGVLVYFWISRNNDSTSDNNTSINYAPPTEQETRAGNDIKASQPDNNTESSDAEANSSDLKDTEVIITDSSQYEDVVEVRAFMPNVVENGSCMVVFMREGVELKYKEAAKADASSTICLSQNFNRSEFKSPGTWRVSVTYLSENYQGSSSSELEIK